MKHPNTSSQGHPAWLGITSLAWGALLIGNAGMRLWGWEPCVLCMMQRASFFLLGFGALLLWWIPRPPLARQMLWVFLIMFWVLGQTIAGYQWSLEFSTSPESMGGCLPSWEMLWSHYSVKDIVALVWNSKTPCSSSPLFAGLSLAWWGTLVHAFIGLLLCSMLLRNKSGLLHHP